MALAQRAGLAELADVHLTLVGSSWPRVLCERIERSCELRRRGPAQVDVLRHRDPRLAELVGKHAGAGFRQLDLPSQIPGASCAKSFIGAAPN
jgi:hypothetical protein